MLFRPELRFRGLSEDAFGVFDIPDRAARRRAILERFHPDLQVLGDDLVARLRLPEEATLHVHLPRLDWPANYRPFCTWLALSLAAHGYQTGPQLNVGVHRDHVAARLAWDASAAGFGRFEFVCSFDDLGDEIVATARTLGLRFRVYAAAPWPEGSRLVFDDPTDIAGAFEEVRRRGVWWEVGIRWDLPEALPIVTSPELAERSGDIFEGILPSFLRASGFAS